VAYPPPAQGYRYPARPPGTNAMAIASVVIGIASFVLVPFIGGITAVILGHVALNHLKTHREEGRGLAIGGLVLGYANVAISILVICLYGASALAFCGIAALSGGVDSPTPGGSEPPSFAPTQTPTALPTG
jgi:hypothetical protein